LASPPRQSSDDTSAKSHIGPQPSAHGVRAGLLCKVKLRSIANTHRRSLTTHSSNKENENSSNDKFLVAHHMLHAKHKVQGDEAIGESGFPSMSPS
jgi:hypothetical protein